MKKWTGNHNNRLRNNAVRIKTDSKEGSGILYKTKDSLYVVSVSHCLGDNRWKNALIEYSIRDVDGNSVFYPLKIKGNFNGEYIKEKGIDYAILEVEFPNSYENLRFEDITFSSEIPEDIDHRAFGFPSFNRNGESLCLEYQESGKWKVTDTFEEIQEGFIECMKGFSGAAIVDYDENDKKVCWGIIRSSEGDKGKYRKALACTPRHILRWLGDGKEEIESVNLIEDNRDYIPRYCSTSQEIGWNYYLGEIRKRYTLTEYVSGEVEDNFASHFLLIGGAQTGKSYELKHLAHELGLKGKQVIFIDFSTNPDFSAIAVSDDSVVIMDAFDEAGIKNVADVSKKLGEFADKYKGITIVVSCRSNFIEFLKDYDFVPLYLEDMSVSDIRDYISTKGFQDPNSVVDLLRSSEIGAMCTTPFNLRFVIDKINVNDGVYNLPSSITQMYDKYVEELFDAEKDKSVDDIKNSYSANLRLLKKMALVLMTLDRNTLLETEVQKVVGNKANLSLLKRNGVVNVENGVWGFRNNTFKEFIAGMALADKSLEEVKLLVCYAGTEKIMPGWYNSLGFWIRIKSETDGRVDGDITEWLAQSSKNLLLYSDPTVLPDKTRVDIVKAILEDYKSENSLFGMYYSGEFEKLYTFGRSRDLISYLQKELDTINEVSSHLYNIMSLLAYVDWKKQKEIEPKRTKDLKDLIISKLDIIKDREHSLGMFFWILSSEDNYKDPEIMESVMDKLKDNCHPDVVSGICAIIAQGEYADQYAGYLYKALEIIHDGNHRIVSNEYLYSALVSFQETDNVVKTLDLITEEEFLRKRADREDYESLFKQLLERLLKSGKTNEFLQYRDKLFPPKLRFPRYRALYEIVKSLACEYGIEDVEFDTRMEQIMNPHKKTEEQEKEDQKRRENAFACLWDYETFRRLVEMVADNCDANPGHDPYDYCYSDLTGYNNYVADFFAEHGDWKTFDSSIVFDSSNVRAKIADKNIYELFRFEKTLSNLLRLVNKVEISGDKITKCVELGHKLLILLSQGKCYQDFSYSQLALEMMVNGMIEVDEPTALALLPYGFESFPIVSESGVRGDTKSVFDSIMEIIGEDRLAEIIRDRLGKTIHYEFPNSIDPVRFLLKRGEKDDIVFLLDKAIELGDSAFSFMVVQQLMYKKEYLSMIMEKYSMFATSIKLEIASNIGVDERFVDIVNNDLENNFDSFSDFEKRYALRILIKNGNLFALRTICENRDDFLKEGEFFKFNYFSIESLDYLINLLMEFGVKGERYTTVINSIIVSMGNIASVSDETLDTVVKRTKDITSRNEKFQLLRQSEEYFHNRRLQAIQGDMSLESALKRL